MLNNEQGLELLPCPFCGKQPHRNGRVKVGGVLCSSALPVSHRVQAYGKDQAAADAAWNTRALTPSREVVLEEAWKGHLQALLKAQKVEPYNGWSITELNQAADAARAFLGWPSIRDLNPDIAQMIDHATENRDSIRALASPSSPQVSA